MDCKEISEEKEYGLSNKNYCFSFEMHVPREMACYLYFSLFESKSSNMEKLECMLKLFDYNDELPNQEPLKLNFDKLKYLILNGSIGGQIRKLKTKLKNKNVVGISFNNIEDDTETLETPIFVKNKVVTAQKMSLDDAIINMEALGHSFYIFVDQDNQKLTVVYKRTDGNYASIEINE